MRVLIVEDEPALAGVLKELFGQQGYSADVAGTVFHGIEAASTNAYDCAIVDVSLPDGDGRDLVAELRELNCNTPVVMLTARNEVADRVIGLNKGADDYLGKPFDPTELVARVNALVRRNAQSRDLDMLSVGKVKLYRNSRTLEYGSKLLELSSKEFMLLEYLFRNQKHTLTRDQLVWHVWGPDAEVAENALDTYIYFLRKKCAKIGLKNVVKTIRGQGYALGPLT